MYVAQSGVNFGMEIFAKVENLITPLLIKKNLKNPQ